MAKYFSESGLYWRPLGGNNIDQISGHCYQYTDVVISEKAPKATTILVDLGKFDNHQALGIKNSVAAVPDIHSAYYIFKCKCLSIFKRSNAFIFNSYSRVFSNFNC